MLFILLGLKLSLLSVERFNTRFFKVKLWDLVCRTNCPATHRYFIKALHHDGLKKKEPPKILPQTLGHKVPHCVR